MKSVLQTNRPQTTEEKNQFLHILLKERFGESHPEPRSQSDEDE